MKKILAVSTDQQLLEMLEQSLSAIGFGMDTLDTQEDLLNELQLQKPDVLIIDFILGDGNAAAVCHQVTSSPDISNLPIIILSDQPGMDQLGAKLGCFSVIKKPLANNLLEKTSSQRLYSISIHHSYPAIGKYFPPLLLMWVTPKNYIFDPYITTKKTQCKT